MTRTTPSRGLTAGVTAPPFHSDDTDPLVLSGRDLERVSAQKSKDAAQ